MSTRTFRLSVDRAEGALERVLGVVRRRRLGLERFSVDPAADGRWDIAIRAAASEAEAGLALRQFTALIDVRTARVDDATT
jgi:acetolactate synthase regulatory subunit